MSDDAQKQNVKRRDFIATGAVTAAATTMTPAVKATSDDEKLVVAVMGMNVDGLADTFASTVTALLNTFVTWIKTESKEPRRWKVKWDIGLGITTWETFVDDDEVILSLVLLQTIGTLPRRCSSRSR